MLIRNEMFRRTYDTRYRSYRIRIDVFFISVSYTWYGIPKSITVRYPSLLHGGVQQRCLPHFFFQLAAFISHVYQCFESGFVSRFSHEKLEYQLRCSLRSVVSFRYQGSQLQCLRPRSTPFSLRYVLDGKLCITIKRALIVVNSLILPLESVNNCGMTELI